MILKTNFTWKNEIKPDILNDNCKGIGQETYSGDCQCCGLSNYVAPAACVKNQAFMSYFTYAAVESCGVPSSNMEVNLCRHAKKPHNIDCTACI